MVHLNHTAHFSLNLFSLAFSLLLLYHSLCCMKALLLLPYLETQVVPTANIDPIAWLMMTGHLMLFLAYFSV
jgi:hypothetical protein